MVEGTEVLDTPKSVPDHEQHNHRAGQIALLLFLTGILLLLGWLSWKAWTVYRSANSLIARQAEIEELMDGGWQAIDPQAAEALVMGIRSDVTTLEQNIAFLTPILPYLSPLPKIGPLADAAPYLLEMADAGTEAAAYGFRALKPALEELQTAESDESMLPALLAAIADGRSDLAKTSLALDRLAEARAQISDVESLPWRVRTLLEKGDEWLPIGQDFSRIALVLPELAGFNGPRRYLLLAQNEDELRPTGGFISGAGYLEVDDGQIVDLEFGDANLVDAWEVAGKSFGKLTKPYDTPPEPLQEFMLLDLFLFRDANFWPDFAISGQKAMDLYAYGRDVPPLDGAIGIDQQFLKSLLNGLGPVSLPETGEQINSQNIISSLQEAWTLQDGVFERKAFLGLFAAAIQNRIQNGFNDIDPLYLANQLFYSLEQKDLQIYSRDPETAAILAANNWDGRLHQTDNGDVLMIVDTNMSYNKANSLIDRSATYDVQLASDGDVEAQLTVNHTHHGEPSDEICWQGVTDEYQNQESYKALIDKCYWNYMRIYVPEGSVLLEGPQHLIPGETWFGDYDIQRESETLSEIPGFTTFDSWMLLPRGEEISSQFRYTLPGSVVREAGESYEYSLDILKQAGTRAQHVQVSVTIPAGKTILSASPTPAAVEGDTTIFALELDSDQTISLTYQ
jgi:hypothetical protein